VHARLLLIGHPHHPTKRVSDHPSALPLFAVPPVFDAEYSEFKTDADRGLASEGAGIQHGSDATLLKHVLERVVGTFEW